MRRRIIISEHAKQRADERLGLSLKPFLKIANKARRIGIKNTECTGLFRKYLDDFCNNGNNVNNVRVYGEFVYLFAFKTLVTVLHLPNEYKKIAQKIIAKRGALSEKLDA